MECTSHVKPECKLGGFRNVSLLWCTKHLVYRFLSWRHHHVVISHIIIVAFWTFLYDWTVPCSCSIIVWFYRVKVFDPTSTSRFPLNGQAWVRPAQGRLYYFYPNKVRPWCGRVRHAALRAVLIDAVLVKNTPPPHNFMEIYFCLRDDFSPHLWKIHLCASRHLPKNQIRVWQKWQTVYEKWQTVYK